LIIIYFGGVQLLTIGILGHYIGSLFDEVKRRPEYIVDETMNLNAARRDEQYLDRQLPQHSQGPFVLIAESQGPVLAQARKR
jgi:hypothetical protein